MILLKKYHVATLNLSTEFLRSTSNPVLVFLGFENFHRVILFKRYVSCTFAHLRNTQVSTTNRYVTALNIFRPIQESNNTVLRKPTIKMHTHTCLCSSRRIVFLYNICFKTVNRNDLIYIVF